MGFPMTNDHCENLIETADQDGDGSLDLKEFVNFVLYGVLKIEVTEVCNLLCASLFHGTDLDLVSFF